MKWHKGPPPSVGWWPASTCKDVNDLRWWNGEWWSHLAPPDMTATQAAQAAWYANPYQLHIEWTDRPADWPERSKT